MFTDKSGQRVPKVTFKVRRGSEWAEVSSDDIFKNKTVVVFSLPGAFTPTCSSSHVPRYNQLAKTFKEHGVDDIVCVSVNDTFVMNAWQADQHADQITFLPDGNGEFTDKMGMLVEKDELGFGKRSWRYSMLVKDGVIDKMFIEPDKEGDPFEVSDADTMLTYIDPKCEYPADVAIITKPGCPYCAKAKVMLDQHGIDYEEIVASHAVTQRSLLAISGASTYPQVFVNGEHIGDSVALSEWLEKRKVA